MTVADIPQLIERARAHLDVEDFEAARSDYEAVLARDKDMTEALIGLGDSCFGLGEYDISEHAYRAALEAAPSDPDALFGLAAVLRVTEYYEEAVSFMSGVSTRNRANRGILGAGILTRNVR